MNVNRLIRLFAIVFFVVTATARARENGSPLPKATQIKTLFIEFDHPDEVGSVEFAATPEDWKAIRSTLLPAKRDPNPADREGLGRATVTLNDGRRLQIDFYDLQSSPGAFAIGSTPQTRTYYRGGDPRKLHDALLGAYESATGRPSLVTEKSKFSSSFAQAVHGPWEYVLVNKGRRLEPPTGEEALAHLTINRNRMSRQVVGIPITMRYSIDANQDPKQIDIVLSDHGDVVVLKGVYELRRSVLILKLAKLGGPRPKSITFDPDEDDIEFSVLARVKESAKP